MKTHFRFTIHSVQSYKYDKKPLARRSGRCNVGRMPVATVKTTFGNELDRTHGLDWYDSQARHYDPTTLRTTIQDPHSEHYYDTSPYSWCKSNPLRYSDPNGMDVAILLLNPSEGQHMAMLIQDENKNWQYYSVNGDNVYVSGKFMGGRPFNDVGVGKWNSPQQFLDSKYNSKGKEADKSINSFGYDRAYVIKSSKKQDEMMRDTFSDIATNTDYKVFGNNCATAVQKTLYDAGISVANPSEKTIQIPANPYLGEPSYKIIKPNFSILPSAAFKAIINNNNGGNLIYKK